MSFAAKKAWFLILGAIILGLFPLLMGKTLFYGDNFSLIVPGKLYSISRIKDGVMPWWNPYILNGHPHFADINQSVMYPTTLIFGWLSAEKALSVSIISHLWITGMGMYFLVRSLNPDTRFGISAALTWVFSGSYMWGVHNLSVVQSATWIPFLLLYYHRWLITADKKYFLWFVLSLCLSILGGHPQITFIGLVSVFGLALLPSNKTAVKKAFFMVAAGMITFLLLLPQLYATHELAGLSTRFWLDAKEYYHQTFPGIQALTLIIPTLFLQPDIGMIWGPQWNRMPMPPLFVPWLVLFGLLFLITKKTKSREWLGVALMVAGIVFSFIGAPQLVISWFRNAPINLFMFHLGLSLITPDALESLTQQVRNKLIIPAIFMILGIILIISWLSLSVWFEPLWLTFFTYYSANEFHTLERDTIIIQSLLLATGVAAVLTGIGIRCLQSRQFTAMEIALGCYLIFFFRQTLLVLPGEVMRDIPTEASSWLHSHLVPGEKALSLNGYKPWSGLITYDENALKRPPFSESWFDEEEKHSGIRLIHLKESLPLNWNMPVKMPSPYGYSAFMLTQTAKWWNIDTSVSNNVNSPDIVPLADERLKKSGLRYLLVDLTAFGINLPVELSELQPAHQAGNMAIYRFSETEQPVWSLSDSGMKLRSYDLVNQDIDTAFTLTRAARVVLNTTYYPGWSCTNQGLECNLQSEGPFISLDLPAGNHHIQLTFKPQHSVWLWSISGLSWIGLLAAFGLPKKRITLFSTMAGQ
jgi:hypothetical protein